jgi:hypothetical protein
MMLLLLFYSFPPKINVGTDVVHAVILFGVTGWLQFRAGNVDSRLVVALLIGSIPGGLLGSHLATRVPMLWLRRILCALLLITGARMLWACRTANSNSFQNIAHDFFLRRHSRPHRSRVGGCPHRLRPFYTGRDCNRIQDWARSRHRSRSRRRRCAARELAARWRRLALRRKCDNSARLDKAASGWSIRWTVRASS